MRGLLATVLLAAAVLVSTAAPSAAQSSFDTPYGPGFSATIGRASVECLVAHRRLDCLNYAGKPPSNADCDFGGAVARVVTRRSGRARKSFTCIDEAFHDYKNLRRGRSFRAGAFRCFHGKRALRCHNRDHTFAIGRRGRVTGAA